MRILLAAACADDRNLGVPGVMHSLADEFRHRGHEVRLRFQKGGGRSEGLFFGARLALSRDSSWADVVDAHAVDAWPLCCLPRRGVVVARSHGLELVQHRLRLARVARGEARIGPAYPLYRGSARLAMERASMRRSDLGLLLNQGDLEIAATEFLAPRSRLRLVRNGFPSAFLGFPIEGASGERIAVVGTWSHRKGCDVVARILTDLMARREGLQALLVGTGVPAEEVLAPFPPLIRSRVSVHPRFAREQLPELLAGAAILLFPSRSEGYPLSLVEAMACGLVPVASAIPGVVDIVEHGRDGLLAEPGDAEAFRDAVVRLLDDVEERGRMRRNARARIAADSWSAIADWTLEQYSAALAARGTA